MTRSGLLIICSCDHLKQYNSQGSVIGSILSEVSKDAKLNVWFFKTVEVCGLTKELAPNIMKVLVPKVVSFNGAKTGVLICETKWSWKWRKGGEVMKFGADALIKLSPIYCWS